MRCRASASRPRETAFLSLRGARSEVHSRAAPFAVQPSYHSALAFELVLFDGNSIAKVCKLASVISGHIQPPFKSGRCIPTANNARGRTDIQAPRAFNVSFFFGDVLVTQLGELGSERVFVGEAAEIEDERVVLYAPDYRNR